MVTGTNAVLQDEYWAREEQVNRSMIKYIQSAILRYTMRVVIGFDTISPSDVSSYNLPIDPWT